MSAFPNKPTLVAAALYGISTQAETETRKGKVKLPWAGLTDDQRKPFLDASEYLLGQSFGVSPDMVNRAKLAADVEKQKFAGLDADANKVVAVFVSIASVLT